MSNLGNRGRPVKKYNQDEIENIVKLCKKELGIIGLIKYSVIYKFALELFNDGKISYQLSEDFWRKPNRQGTLALQAINEIIEDTVHAGESEVTKTISTFDAVNKLYTGKVKDKKELINKLTLNEVKAKQYIRKNSQLESKVKKLQNEVLDLKEQREQLKAKVDELQNVLFKFMEYSKMKDFPVENIFNTGKTRTKPVDLILKSMFGDDPSIGFDFERYIKQKEAQTDNMVQLKVKPEKSALDDYGEF